MINSLRVTETFLSLQGETSFTGQLTFFIRLTGCPLRCQYCDTAYAFEGGQQHPIDALVAAANASGACYITVTGGEPLAQKATLNLLTALCDQGLIVSLETSGALDYSDVDQRVIKIVDIKTPGSGEVGRNQWAGLARLNRQDQIKFVICDRDDYLWSKFKIEEFELDQQVNEILFSPSQQQLSAKALANWIIEDRLRVRMQIQLHKVLWGDVPGK